MLLTYKQWCENMWGNTPSNMRKPSDGWACKQSYSSNSSSAGNGSQPMQKSMKKKMKK
jgi:hypothetical protein